MKKGRTLTLEPMNGDMCCGIHHSFPRKGLRGVRGGVFEMYFFDLLRISDVNIQDLECHLEHRSQAH